MTDGIAGMITIETPGGSMPAYLARPSGPGRYPTVVLFQEIFGITAELRRIADHLAAEDYIVVLPALYYRTDPSFLSGYDSDGMTLGKAAREAISLDALRGDLEAIMDWIVADEDADGRIATWGFCWGGSVAFYSATLPEVDAAIAFYGAQIIKSSGPLMPPMIDQTPDIQAPVYFAFGGKDGSIPGTDIDQIRDTMVDNEKAFQIQYYPTEGHAFFRFFGSPQQSQAAADVWPRVLGFLKNTLPERADD